MMRVTKLLALVVPLLFAAQAFGQSGKIAGRVTDAGTGDGLPGVNVAIEGTTVGTVTDVEGYYTIINVRPGSYTVRASFVGYTPEAYENARVSIGLTTTLDYTLREQVVEGEELVVTAERPIVQLDVSANVASLNPAEFVDLPVAGVSEVIDMQAGIEPGLQIRGGGANEIAFVVDGMNMRTGRHQSPLTTVSYTALEEVQVQTGGFNAEYGNVRSGVVNVTTKEPSRTRYTFDGMFRYAPVQEKALNPLGMIPEDISECGFGTDDMNPACDVWHVRAGLDPETAFVGSGAWDIYTERQYREHQGWNTLAENQQASGFDVTPQDLYEYYQYTKRKDNRIDNPDYTADVTIGGPLIPGLSGMLGDLRFLASYRGQQTAYMIPIQRDTYNSDTFTGKLVSNPRPNMKLSLHGMYSSERSIIDNGDAREVTGYNGWLSTYPWGGNAFVMSDNGIRGREEYSDAYTGTGDIDHWMLGATFTHSINASTFYEISVQNVNSKYSSKLPQFRDATYVCPESGTGPDGNLCTPGLPQASLYTNYGVLRPEGEGHVGVDSDNDGFIDVTCFGGNSDLNGDGEIVPYCMGEEPFGWGAIGGSLLDGASTGGHWNKLLRDETETGVFSGRFDLTSQVNRFMQLKTGAELIVSDYKHDVIFHNIDLGGTPQFEQWDRTPIQGAAYAQTKLEFQGMIANVGLRLDYMDPNTQWWDFSGDPYSDAFRGQIDDLDEQLSTLEPDAQIYVSPRVGVSFPITENSKLYFNYGHFRQQLEASQLFGYRTSAAGGVDLFGNPDHPMPKTVAYELGFDQNVADQFLLRISGFYRDIRAQTRSVVYESLGGVVNYTSYRPWNYEDVRGFEVSLNKTSGKWWRGFLNYTFLQTKNGNFGYANFYENTYEMIRYLDTSTDYRINAPIASPFARANIIFLTPVDANPIIADWRISLLGEWRQGTKFTWSSLGNYPELQDNVRWRNYQSWQLRFTKHIVSPLGDLQLFLDVDNVFNRMHLYQSTAFMSQEADYDRERYFWSLHLPEDIYDDLNQIEPDDPFAEKLQYTPYIWIPGSDNPGDYRGLDVDFQPMEAVQSLGTVADPNDVAWYWAADTEQYSRWNGSGWEQVPQADVDQAISDKAYIDMPNRRDRTFLNPRRFTLGIRISI